MRKVELLVMAILLSNNIAQCDDSAVRRPRGATTARRDDLAAVGWAWTGRNVMLDGALTMTLLTGSARWHNAVNDKFVFPPDTQNAKAS